MINVIHFHSGGGGFNIGDDAVACSIRDMLCRHLKVGEYASMGINKLRERRAWNSQLLSKPVSPQTINTYDLCIIGGGGLYSNWYFPLDNQLIRSIKAPIILFGIGCNRDFGERRLSESSKRSIVMLNRHARLSSVRDRGTYFFLKKVGIKNVELVGDPVIFLEAKRRKANLNITHEKEPRIGINVACHNYHRQSRYLKSVIATYARVCRFLIDSRNAQIVYLKHTPSEDFVVSILKEIIPITVANYCPDYDLLRRLKIRFPFLPMRLKDCRPYEIDSVYSSLDLVIGMHLHSAIFAFKNCVPVINVAYNVKNYYFMDLIEERDKTIYVDQVDSLQLKKMINHAMSDSSKTRRKFKILKDKMWKKQEAFLQKIKFL